MSRRFYTLPKVTAAFESAKPKEKEQIHGFLKGNAHLSGFRFYLLDHDNHSKNLQGPTVFRTIAVSLDNRGLTWQEMARAIKLGPPTKTEAVIKTAKGENRTKNFLKISSLTIQGKTFRQKT